MKLKWQKKKLTLVIIPEANQSVIRFRISNVYAYIVAASLLTLILAALVTYFIHMKTINETALLKTELKGTEQQLDLTLSANQQTVEQLQNKVIQLSQQAEEMKAKVEEMKKLESDLKGISQLNPSSESNKVAQAPTGNAGSQGVGGTMIPVSQEGIEHLTVQTQETFTSIGEQINLLRTSFSNTKQKLMEKQLLTDMTPTLWPTTTKAITSGFGYRRDPFSYQPSFHSGIDFPAPENDLVFATALGTVSFTGLDSSHGNNIIIDHTRGIQTRYMHLNKILVKAGDSVQKGQKIGLVGSTGRSTGAHLHYEVLKRGTPIDPTPYLQTMRKDD